MKLTRVLGLTVAVCQVELHPLLAQRKLVGVSYRKGVVSVAHSCLVRQAPEVAESPLVQRVAAETGKTINQVCVGRGCAWCYCAS